MTHLPVSLALALAALLALLGAKPDAEASGAPRMLNIGLQLQLSDGVLKASVRLPAAVLPPEATSSR